MAAKQTYRALCSRLRRGILYRIARDTDCQAVVLGQHSDDTLETFFPNLFLSGRLSMKPPKLLNEDDDLPQQVLRHYGLSDYPLSSLRVSGWFAATGDQVDAHTLGAGQSGAQACDAESYGKCSAIASAGSIIM